MKTPEEMMAYFRSIPKQEKANPYWKYDKALGEICTADGTPVDMAGSQECLSLVRAYFRQVFQCFHTEAQVLCLSLDDAAQLHAAPVPSFPQPVTLCKIPVVVFVPPQVNSTGLSSVSEAFWQEQIAGKGIVPVARIHSHHVLFPYQSATDYSTLNSNSLEMVMGRIFEPAFQIGIWLDKHGTDQKSIVFTQQIHPNGTVTKNRIPSGKPVPVN